MNRNLWKFWLSFVVATSLLPVAAWADDHSAKELEIKSDDLNLTETSVLTFNGFSMDLEQKDGSSSASIHGRIAKSCVDSSELSVKFVCKEDGNGKLGFKITDPNGVARRCMSKIKKEHKTCNALTNNTMDKDHCINLSTIDGSIENPITCKDSGALGLFSRDEDSETDKFSEYSPKLSYKSLQDVDKEKAKEAAEAAKLKRAEKLNKKDAFKRDFESCIKTEDGLERARQTLSELSEFSSELSAYYGKLDKAEEKLREKRAKKEHDKDLKELQRRAFQGKDEDLSSLRSELKDWLIEHPEDTNIIANSIAATAFRDTAGRENDPQAWAEAAALLQEAMELEGISPAMAKKLQGYLLREILPRLDQAQRNQYNSYMGYPGTNVPPVNNPFGNQAGNGNPLVSCNGGVCLPGGNQGYYMANSPIAANNPLSGASGPASSYANYPNPALNPVNPYAAVSPINGVVSSGGAPMAWAGGQYGQLRF